MMNWLVTAYLLLSWFLGVITRNLSWGYLGSALKDLKGISSADEKDGGFVYL